MHDQTQFQEKEDHVLADIEEYEEMYLLGGRYGGGRGEVPACRQIWRRTRRCTCLEADREEDEKMYLLGGRYEGGRGDVPAWRHK